MKYRKPEITTTAPALDAVQSAHIKVQTVNSDGNDDYATTPGAYEADE